MKELRYTIGQEVTVKHGSSFAETFEAGGIVGVIVDYDEEEEFDYKIQIGDDEIALLINDDELE